MCEPTTIALLAVTAATAVGGYVVQNQQAKAVEKAAIEEAKVNNAALYEREVQINKQAADQQSERARQALIERGRLRAAAGESGAFDNTGRLEAESFFSEGYDVASMESNRAAAVRQNRLDLKGVEAQQKSRINTSGRPSIIATSLSAAGAGLQIYSGQANKTPPKTKS